MEKDAMELIKEKDTEEQKDTKKLSFEEHLKRLEQITEQMRKGDLPLQQALDLYRAGVLEAQTCRDLLAHAEAQIQVLNQSGENWVAEPLEDHESAY